jgi:hypothetical protein
MAKALRRVVPKLKKGEPVTTNVRGYGEVEFDPELGLCKILGSYLVQNYASSWQFFSQDILHPVPCTHYQRTARDVYNDTPTKYSGEYGKLRINLLDFIIQEIEKDISELSKNTIHI